MRNSDCLFCGKPDNYGGKRTEFKLTPVRNLDFQHRILAACKERQDQWAETVKARVANAIDLPAADALYHKLCSGHFRTGKKIPVFFLPEESKSSNPKRVKCGRPEDLVKSPAFIRVADYLVNNDEEQTTINDLIEKMSVFMEEDYEPYCFTHMEYNIEKKFGDQIIITEINGRSNVVTFRSTASKILYDFLRSIQEQRL